MNKEAFCLSIRIITLFVVAILLSFIPDYLHSFFGDWQCKGFDYHNTTMNCNYSGFLGTSNHGAGWHWGYRHWLFTICGIILSIIQLTYIEKDFSEGKFKSK